MGSIFTLMAWHCRPSLEGEDKCENERGTITPYRQIPRVPDSFPSVSIALTSDYYLYYQNVWIEGWHAMISMTKPKWPRHTHLSQRNGQLPVSLEEVKDKTLEKDDLSFVMFIYIFCKTTSSGRCMTGQKILLSKGRACDIRRNYSRQFIYTLVRARELFVSNTIRRKISFLKRRWRFQWRPISTLTQTNKKFDALPSTKVPRQTLAIWGRK